MLKRLKALFGPNKQAMPSTDEAETPITVYDEHGRELKISRQDWRDKVLQPNLRKHWDDPDALYQQILTAVNDDFASEVVEAARHLVGIDPIAERAHTMHGIVLMKNRRLDEARTTLEAGLVKAGRSGVLLTNLAKVEYEQGEHQRAHATLWDAVQADPNLDNGLQWWLSIQRDNHGEAGYLEALRAVAALPGSWRAQLWLARHHLEQRDADAALALYRGVLSRTGQDGGALTMISGDLGNNGQAAAIPDLIGPVYDPGAHGIQPGLNLLRALHEARRIDEGEALLGKLYALEQPPFKQHLDGFAQAFRQLRSAVDGGREVDPAQLQLRLMALDQPVWHYGLRQADWLFAQKTPDALKIGFSPLSIAVHGENVAKEEKEDDAGRLTRAIVLYLAEAVHYWTDLKAVVHAAVVENSGPVVFGAPEDASVCERAPGDMPWYITGEIAVPAQPGGGYVLTLRLWECARRALAATETATCDRAGIGQAVLALERALLARLGHARDTALDGFYRRPSEEAMDPYLSCLGQSFTLSMIANGVGAKDTLWGERAILEWPLSMALHWPQAEVAKLMHLSGLGKAADYGSEVLPEFRQRSLALLRQAAPNSPAARLAPIAWMAFGMRDDLAFNRSALASSAAPEYLAWLDRVETVDRP